MFKIKKYDIVFVLKFFAMFCTCIKKNDLLKSIISLAFNFFMAFNRSAHSTINI